MKYTTLALTIPAALALIQPVTGGPQDEGADAIYDAMAKAGNVTAPGPHHKQLERFIGTWDLEIRLSMAGQATPPTSGRVTISWLMPGRWLKSEGSSSFMGIQVQTFSILGYDNFKRSFVTSRVTSMDTAMHYAEGDMTRTGDALLMYGTLDEYLTGEHDKMVKSVWRFPSADKMIFEIHDLPIGETHTKVVEMTYTRVK